MGHNVTATSARITAVEEALEVIAGEVFREEAVDSGEVVVGAEESKGLLFLAEAITPAQRPRSRLLVLSGTLLISRVRGPRFQSQYLTHAAVKLKEEKIMYVPTFDATLAITSSSPDTLVKLLLLKAFL